MKRGWRLGLAVGVSLIAFAGLTSLHHRTGTLRFTSAPEAIFWYLVAFVGFGLAVWHNEKVTIPRWVFWGFPVLLRLMMLTTVPSLSDDVYRYLWDGHVASVGVNPYTYPISDPALDQYEIPVRALANNPDLSSPYLPAAHGVFSLAAALLPSEPLTLQVVMVAFDLAAAFLLSRLLALSKLPPKRLLLFLWNPLVIIETAHGAHLDALMMALMTLGLVLTLDEKYEGRWPRQIGAPVAIALAVLTRPIPAFVLPVLFWRWTWRQRLTWAVTTAAIVLPFGIGPGFGLTGEPTGTGVFGSARVYTQSFRFNSGVYHWVERWISSQGLDDRGWNEPVELTRLIFTCVTVAVLIAVWWRGRAHRADTPRAVLRLILLPIAAYVFLTPVFHPWYLIVIIAFSTFVAPAPDESPRRWLLLVPWIWLVPASTLSYLTYRVPEAYAELEWVRRLEWIPAISLAIGATLVAITLKRTHPVKGSSL